MAIREYQFITGIETSTSPDPATPSSSGDTITKGYADVTYAKYSSWQDKQADNTAVKAISSANRHNGQVVLKMDTNSFYRFDSSSSAADDGDTVLQPTSGAGRWLKITSSGGGSGNELVYELDEQIAGITAGEAISANDAVCVAIHNGTGSNVFRIFKAKETDGNRRGFLGFAKSAATVTPQITTYTISAAYVSGNVIPITINGSNISVTYASSSDATLQALATAIQAHEDVLTATVTVEGGNQTGTDDRVITITSEGGLSLNITGTTITGGASQPTVTLNNTQTASGQAVDIAQFSHLAGFSGLNIGNKYYVSSTSGAITDSPSTDNPILVGVAFSATTLLLNPNKLEYTFGDATRAVFSGGSNAVITMNYVQVSSLSNAVYFGDLSEGKRYTGSCGSSTRGLVGGGANSGGTRLNVIDYFTFSTPANVTDFGDLTIAREAVCSTSNSTRGLWAGGATPAATNTIDYVTIATTGNAIDFGDLTRSHQYIGAGSSTTRSVFCGGSNSATTDYVTIATTGNASAFGSLTIARNPTATSAGSTRCVSMGGEGAAWYNVIDYLTIASIGNSVDFGDLLAAQGYQGGAASKQRALVAGGNNPSVNTIEYINIFNLSNSAAFGNLTYGTGGISGCSNGHGGI